MKRKIISLVLGISMLFSNIPILASVTNDRITLEEIQDNQQLKDEIDTYLNTKLNTTFPISVYNIEETSELQESMINRADGFCQMEERADIEFSDVEISSCIKEIVSQTDEELVLEVYEWTGIEYYASPDSDTTDIMGYGIDHEMTFDIIDGEYVLVEDSFDERLVTGVCSEDILLNSMGETQSDILVDDAEDYVLTNQTRATYNVQAAIIYANRYCGVAIASQNFGNDSGVNTGTYHTSLYNQNYTIYPNKDCANFVSQCLVAGGLSTDSTWKTYTEAWVNARKLATYLTSKGYSSYTATNSNVYPGNPVYWLNAVGAVPSGHQMICTGYNSANVPVVNGHNSDMFRVPITSISGSLKTIHIVSSDQHTHVADGGYHYSTSAHYYTCKYCRDNYNISGHNVVSSGSGQYCSVCGYTGPFASYNSLSVCGEEGIEPEIHN